MCIGIHPSGGAASKTPPLCGSPAPSAPSGPTCSGRSRLRYRGGGGWRAPGAARWRPTSGTDGGDASPFGRGHPRSPPLQGSRPHPGCPRAKSDVLKIETPEGAVRVRREKTGRREKPGWEEEEETGMGREGCVKGGARLVGAPPGDGRRKTSRRPFNSQRRCSEFRPGSGGVRSPGFTSELAASGTPRNRCCFFHNHLLLLFLLLPFRRTGRERGVWRKRSSRGRGGWRGAATGGGPPGAEP